MKNIKPIATVAVILGLMLSLDPALAGPGGKIASSAFGSVAGRIFEAVLYFVFFPLIAYFLLREKVAEFRAKKDLRFMSSYSEQFEWLRIQQRAKDCFFRVHSGWEKEDLAEVSEWMTNWYWQNQQQVYLDRWRSEGLKNICHVKKIWEIKPLLFIHRNDGEDHEGSMVVLSIEAEMKDYLENRETNKVVEGNKRYKKVETIWTLIMDDGSWKVSDIEEDYMSISYAKLRRDLPKIETTIRNNMEA